VAVFRLGQALCERDGIVRMLRPAYTVLWLFTMAMTNVEIGRGAQIGPGFWLVHGSGVVIHSGTRIGANCTMLHGVTVGQRDSTGGCPAIGDNVEIGAYAQILGPVRVGDASRIGALSLVIHDVPAHATVAGIPARVISSGHR
jgi:serine O-acetyltransferase